MNYEVEAENPETGARSSIVVRLSAEEIADAAHQERTGELVRRSYAFRHASAQLPPGFQPVPYPRAITVH